jgi:hypothetical protein
VNDDPFVWFYYVYGHTTLPPLIFLWIANRVLAPKASSIGALSSGGALAPAA